MGIVCEEMNYSGDQAGFKNLLELQQIKKLQAIHL